MITKGYKANFETLQKAVRNGDVCLMECTLQATGKPVFVICAVHKDETDFVMTPLAKLFDGNPYEEVLPPA